MNEGRAVATNRFWLWVDGVGGYLLCLDSPMILGGPGGDADVPLMADLSRRHAMLRLNGEGYLLDAFGATQVEGRPVTGRTQLKHGDIIGLGSRTRLRFRQPSVLSATALLEPIENPLVLAPRPERSSHATQTVDGIIFMKDTCLIGPGSDRHISCPDGSETLLLFRKGGEFFLKTPHEVIIDGRHSTAGGPLPPGSVISIADVRLRLEEYV